MKATDLLTQQHKKVRAAFKKLEHKRGDLRALLDELASDLAAHMAIEHELLYPAAFAVDEALVNEAFEEHALGEIALKRLLAIDLADEAFPAKVTAVKELIAHHADEEEKDLFPKLEKALGEVELKRLGAEMKARFSEVRALGWAEVYPRGASRTLADGASHKLSRARKRAA